MFHDKIYECHEVIVIDKQISTSDSSPAPPPRCSPWGRSSPSDAAASAAPGWRRPPLPEKVR